MGGASGKADQRKFAVEYNRPKPARTGLSTLKRDR